MSDQYTKSLEHEIERTNKLLSQIGELVDDGIYTTSIKSAHTIFKRIGEIIGLNMEDVVEETNVWDDFDDDEMLTDEDPYGGDM